MMEQNRTGITPYVDGYWCSNFAFIDAAISCSVVKLVIASCAALIANSCICVFIVELFTTGRAVVMFSRLVSRG